MAAKQKRPNVKRVPRPTAPKQTRPELRGIVDGLTKGISRNAPEPELRPALDREIDRAWAGWANAADLAPQIEDAPVVARVLQALREARRLGDQKALRMLDTGARGALDQVAPAVAAETHARYLSELAPGVTVEDLMPRRLQRKGAGPRGDRADAVAGLAEHMERYLTKSSRRSASSGAPMPPLTAEEMAKGFVFLAAEAGPIGRKLKGRGLLPVHTVTSYDANGLRPGSELDAKIKAAAVAFERQLKKTAYRTNSERRWLSNEEGTSRNLGTASTGEDLVRVGLRAIGMSARDVKHLYDAPSRKP